MEIAKIFVNGTTCKVMESKQIPAGAVGLKVSLQYDAACWSGLQKTAVFRGCVTRDVLNAGEEIVIPSEVIAGPCQNLYLGIYGVNTDGDLVVPTLWVNLGRIMASADPSGDESTDPDLPVWAQLQAHAAQQGAQIDSNTEAIEQLKLLGPGVDGEDGATFTPCVDSYGNLSWSNDKGLANPKTVSIMGPAGKTGATGPKGDKGDPGIAPLIVNSITGKAIAISDSVETPLQGLRILGKTTQNGTPTPDVPVPLESVGASGSIGITVAGKNLISLPYLSADGYQYAGITYTVNNDGSVTANGTATGSSWFAFGNAVLYPGRYRLSGCPSGGSANKYAIQAYYTKGDGTTGQLFSETFGTSIVWTVTKTTTMRFMTVVRSGFAANNLTFYPYLALEHLHDGVFEAGVSPQTLTVSTPTGLPGIPVTSGGNYTDENGQQWVCDEVDFAEGVYVQRIGKIDNYMSENISGIYMSTTGNLSEGATVLHVLDDPIEYSLTAEELAQYAVLHTNYPNTTIFNNVGTDMEVKYVADTKLYIDKKFNDLAAALINNA